MTPTDPPASTRPPRRFSALRRPVVRAKPATPVAAEVAEPAPASSPAVAEKASGEARIAKVMARAGLCSRRDAEAWIADGRVSVNGAVIDSPALNVGPDDAVTVDGYPIDKPEKTRLFLFHKARGLVTTSRDPEGRPTIYDALPPDLPRLVTIGRLDINTEGLLLLTNDGGLARLLELPATGWIRRYRVRANGTIDQARLDALAKGLTIDGVTYAGIAAKLDRIQGANVWLTMGLKEGKNREIKRVLEHLGLAVTRLIRISFGPFQLGELGDNAVEEVRTRVLRDQLGTALAKQAGVDFEGSAEEGPTALAPAREGASSRARGSRPAEDSRPRLPRSRPRLDDQPEAPRRKTRRTATEDRRGRAVTIERITSATSGRGDGDRPTRVRPRDMAPPSDRTGDRTALAAGRGDAPRTLRQADRAPRGVDEGRAAGRPERGARPARRDARAEDQSRDAPRGTRAFDKGGRRDERPGRPDRDQRAPQARQGENRALRGDRPGPPGRSVKPRGEQGQRPGGEKPRFGGPRPASKGGGKGDGRPRTPRR